MLVFHFNVFIKAFQLRSLIEMPVFSLERGESSLIVWSNLGFREYFDLVFRGECIFFATLTQNLNLIPSFI
jgi:hypothetical protein